MYRKTKLLHILLFFLIISLLFPVITGLSYAQENNLALVNVSVLNVREGPGTNYRIIGRVTLNQQLEILERRQDWLRVKLPNNQAGWVAAEFVKETGQALKTIKVNANLVNIRSGPGTNYSIIARVQRNDELQVLNCEGDWYQILLSNKQVGWIAGWLVVEVQTNPSGSSPAAETQPEIEADIPPDNNQNNTDTAVPVSDKPPGELQVGIVTVSLLNVRSGPGTNYSLLTQIKKDSQVLILKQSGEWYMVRLPNNQEGWIYTPLVKLIESSSDKSPDNSSNSGSNNSSNVPRETDRLFAEVSTSLLNVRSGPGTSYSNLFQVSRGSLLSVLNSNPNGQWFEVQTDNGQSGWVSGDYILLKNIMPQPIINPGDTAQNSQGLKGKIIIIDPGHGGYQPGAIGITGLMEKTVVLAISKHLQRLLLDSGAAAIMTRTEDVYVSLPSRVQTAESNRADLFISVHANASSTNRSASGTETYYYGYNSHRLAALIQNEVVRELVLRNIGVKHGNFYVIRETTMPSVLVELGFLTNSHDESILKDPYYQNKSAVGIFKAVEAYFR